MKVKKYKAITEAKKQALVEDEAEQPTAEEVKAVEQAKDAAEDFDMDTYVN